MSKTIPTADGLGYWVVLGPRKSFVSSIHLVADKEAQLRRIKEQEGINQLEGNS